MPGAGIDAREQLADVVLDFRHDPSGRGPALRLIPETLVPDQRLVARSHRRGVCPGNGRSAASKRPFTT